jgi:hypothetical protein
MQGFFPLDEELALLPGSLSPRLQEQLVRLGTWMPFERAAEMLADFTKVVVSEPTARRQTEEAGAAYVAIQTAEVERAGAGIAAFASGAGEAVAERGWLHGAFGAR